MVASTSLTPIVYTTRSRLKMYHLNTLVLPAPARRMLMGRRDGVRNIVA